MDTSNWFHCNDPCLMNNNVGLCIFICYVLMLYFLVKYNQYCFITNQVHNSSINNVSDDFMSSISCLCRKSRLLAEIATWQ